MICLFEGVFSAETAEATYKGERGLSVTPAVRGDCATLESLRLPYIHDTDYSAE